MHVRSRFQFWTAHPRCRGDGGESTVYTDYNLRPAGWKLILFAGERLKVEVENLVMF